MIKLGTIGTNWITERMIEAAHATGEYQLTAVYSRHEASGQEIAKGHEPATVYTDLEQFLSDPNVEVVYIASPNVLHYEQILQALQHDKNVIVEKPAVLTPYQYQSVMDELARHPQVRYFEAARNVHMPAFAAVRDYLSGLEMGVDGADFTFSQYSSRYDQVLAGHVSNVFNPQFGGGALTDLGIYPVYDAVSLFGVPERVAYYPTMISTGVDGKGTAILNYGDFDVTLNFSKLSNSTHNSEIYHGREIITFDSAGEVTEASIIRDNQRQILSQLYGKNPMIPEMTDFARVLKDPKQPENVSDYELWLEQMRNVNLVMSRLASSAGLEYPTKLEADE
ncbi:Gfo/Idh/MocA family oxidoreductase [Fructilactobacillus myrtifloralis]|uniref:Gfo/Idh/MocA family oxidoreductase n=1 Tax=Fructilactobacillus myrtifloralis TaxID=2940301 RepID=A0ABY5BQ29_9LACO|nr:Gfo/Idh/MocA family oxidoreductase [Fructilactobacillus myrtifloralis]USS85579.1 Gfo/Idh/MocA family oxidoreductase [Fructilactobacillus myrtifloralis]